MTEITLKSTFFGKFKKGNYKLVKIWFLCSIIRLKVSFGKKKLSYPSVDSYKEIMDIHLKFLKSSISQLSKLKYYSVFNLHFNTLNDKTSRKNRSIYKTF